MMKISCPEWWPLTYDTLWQLGGFTLTFTAVGGAMVVGSVLMFFILDPNGKVAYWKQWRENNDTGCSYFLISHPLAQLLWTSSFSIKPSHHQYLYVKCWKTQTARGIPCLLYKLLRKRWRPQANTISPDLLQLVDLTSVRALDPQFYTYSRTSGSLPVWYWPCTLVWCSLLLIPYWNQS